MKKMQEIVDKAMREIGMYHVALASKEHDLETLTIEFKMFKEQQGADRRAGIGGEKISSILILKRKIMLPSLLHSIKKRIVGRPWLTRLTVVSWGKRIRIALRIRLRSNSRVIRALTHFASQVIPLAVVIVSPVIMALSWKVGMGITEEEEVE